MECFTTLLICAYNVQECSQFQVPKPKVISVHRRDVVGASILWASTKHFRHQERCYLLLLCGIGYNVIKWSHCEFKRDLLYFLNICNYIVLQHINANPIEQCFLGTFTVICGTDLLS